MHAVGYWILAALAIAVLARIAFEKYVGYATGDALPYHPGHRESAVIDSSGERFLAPLPCGILALGAIGFALPVAMSAHESS